jgi:hypothetical protein
VVHGGTGSGEDEEEYKADRGDSGNGVVAERGMVAGKIMTIMITVFQETIRGSVCFLL